MGNIVDFSLIDFSALQVSSYEDNNVSTIKNSSTMINTNVWIMNAKGNNKLR